MVPFSEVTKEIQFDVVGVSCESQERISGMVLG
jgi:hypothetical protein